MRKSILGVLSVGALLAGGLVIAPHSAIGADARPPRDRLLHAMQLNRTGYWDQAAQESEAVAALPGLTDELTCWALESAAYSRLRLHDEAAAERHLKALQASWNALPATHWVRREGASLERELTNPVEKLLRMAMQDNRNGDWAGAREASDAVLGTVGATAVQRAEAGYDAAWATLRLGERSAAETYLKHAEQDVAGISREHWLHLRISGLREELDRENRLK